ncbi:CSC1/OSCA1-like, 7TM region [Dillenia turbinata]|uniref:CSC1/OSCA1-like, 7TM region n=1 Tax=Dillenia turbinata TaxID=194707 RepID=A0AAN8ZL11_9MAGN
MNLAALLTSAGINIGLCVLLLLLYSILRKQPSNVNVYFGRRLAQVQSKHGDSFSLDRLFPSPSWILKAWETSEAEILSVSGLDAVVFLRMLVFSYQILDCSERGMRFGNAIRRAIAIYVIISVELIATYLRLPGWVQLLMRIFSIAAVICILLVLPLNYHGQEMHHKQIPSESLEVFTIANVREGSKWYNFWFYTFLGLSLALFCTLSWAIPCDKLAQEFSGSYKKWVLGLFSNKLASDCSASKAEKALGTLSCIVFHNLLSLHSSLLSDFLLSFFLQEYRSISKMRLAHISQSAPSHFTVLVRSIPWSCEESYSNSVEKFFMEYHASSYLSHQLIYRHSKVQKLMDKPDCELAELFTVLIDWNHLECFQSQFTAGAEPLGDGKLNWLGVIEEADAKLFSQPLFEKGYGFQEAFQKRECEENPKQLWDFSRGWKHIRGSKPSLLFSSPLNSLSLQCVPNCIIFPPLPPLTRQQLSYVVTGNGRRGRREELVKDSDAEKVYNMVKSASAHQNCLPSVRRCGLCGGTSNSFKMLASEQETLKAKTDSSGLDLKTKIKEIEAKQAPSSMVKIGCNGQYRLQSADKNKEEDGCYEHRQEEDCQYKLSIGLYHCTFGKMTVLAVAPQLFPCSPLDYETPSSLLPVAGELQGIIFSLHSFEIKGQKGFLSSKAKECAGERNENCSFEVLLQLKPEECPAAFVFFKTRYAALVASEVMQSSNPMLWVTDLAPEPHDIYWSNLSIPYRQLWIRKIGTLLAAIVFMLLFLIPVTFVQGLTQLDHLQQRLPFLKGILRKQFMSQLVTGYLPSVILLIFLLTVPPTMMLFSAVEGPFSRSGRKKSACCKVLYFTIWNVFFVNVLSGQVIDQLNAISSPKYIPAQLAKAVTAQATFFTTYVLTSGWTSLSFEIMLLFPLLCNLFKRYILRSKDDFSSSTLSFPYHTEVPKVLVFGLLGFTCSIMAPLILPFLLVYFFLAYLVYRNQVEKVFDMGPEVSGPNGDGILNVYVSKYDSGGQYWPIAHNTTIFSLVLTQVIALGVFGIKRSPVASGFTIPLIILTLLFNEYCRQRFNPIFKKIAAEVLPEVLIQMDRQDEQSGGMEEIHQQLHSAYCQFTVSSHDIYAASNPDHVEDKDAIQDPENAIPGLPQLEGAQVLHSCSLDKEAPSELPENRQLEGAQVLHSSSLDKEAPSET